MAAPPADFVGYQPTAVPGAYLFQRRDGQPLAFGGPLAERLKSQIDASAPPDMRVAGPGGAPPTAPAKVTMGPDGWPVKAPPPPNPAVAPVPAKQAVSQPGAAPPPGLPPPPPAIARPDVAGPEQPIAPQNEVVAAGKNGTRYVRDAQGRVTVVGPGSSGTSQKQLAKRAEQGVVTPSKTETVREFTPEGDPDYLESMADISIDKRLLNQQVAERQAAAAAEETLAFGEQAARDQKRAELEAKVVTRAQEEGRRAEAEYDQARNEFRDKKVDPERLFRGPMGTARKIAMAIAQAVGAYAATIGRTANFAQQIVQSRIEEDIAAQREDIRVRGQHADNALANLTRKLGDQKAAEAVLRSAQGDYASSLLRTRAAASKRAEIVDMAQKWDLEEQQRQVDLRNSYLQARQGKIYEKVMGEFAYPTGGSGPTNRPATIEEQMALENLQGKRLSNVAQDQENLGGGKSGDITDQARKEAAEIATGKGRMQAAAKKYGFTLDPNTGEISGDGSFPTRFSPEDFAAFESEMSQIGRSVAGAMNPGSEPHQDLVKGNTPDPTSLDRRIKAKIQAGYQYLLERERNQGLSDQQRETLEQRKQSVNVQRAANAAKPLPAPTPVGR